MKYHIAAGFSVSTRGYMLGYQEHFAHPILHELNTRHEELLACYPGKWAVLIKRVWLSGSSEATVS